MSKANKILYTIVSFLPLAGMAVYMAAFLCMFTDILAFANDPERMHEEFFSGNFIFLISAGLLMGLITIVALVVFIVHVVKNKSLPDTEKIMWVLIFAFVGMIGFPIYWFMRGIKPGESSIGSLVS